MGPAISLSHTGNTMTTIVYDHKRGQIAVDSRASAGGVIKDDSYDKTIVRGDAIWFICGTTMDFERLVDIAESSENGDCYELGSIIDCRAMMVRDGVVYDCAITDGRFYLDRITNNDSMGSGEQFAIAAMDHGKTAKQAVEYAATRDIYTGGKVRVYDIKKGKFTNG